MSLTLHLLPCPPSCCALQLSRRYLPRERPPARVPSYDDISTFVTTLLGLCIEGSTYFSAGDPNQYFMVEAASKLLAKKKAYELAIQKRLTEARERDSWAYSVSAHACAVVCGLAVSLAVLDFATLSITNHIQSSITERVQAEEPESRLEDDAGATWARFFEMASVASCGERPKLSKYEIPRSMVMHMDPCIFQKHCLTTACHTCDSLQELSQSET